jgi:hypothetical protein
LDVRGDPAALIPNEALAYGRKPKQERSRRTRPVKTTVRGYSDRQLAEQALGYLSPGAKDENGREFVSDYGLWLTIGMALYELGDEGLDLWDQWSRGSSKHEPTGPNSCEEKWKTFDMVENSGVQLGTLFHHAKQHGWAFPKRLLFPLSNCEPEFDANGKLVGHHPRSAASITAYLLNKTGGWPRCVNDVLFLESNELKPIFLESNNQLFGALDGLAKIKWMHGASMITQERFFEYLRKFGAERFDAIETLPHYPSMPGTYYLHPPINASGSASQFEALLDFFTPATPADRELIRAAILTLFWGGPPGKRPAFRIEGPEGDPERGRGIGKTTLAIIITELSGGHVRLEEGEEFSAFITRLLSNEHGRKRAVLVDNVKRIRFSWAPLEEFITMPVISGHALFRGEGRRPNTMTVFITVNGGSLSKDLAQRVIPIRLARPTYSARWDQEVAAFIEKHRQDLISEFIRTLADERGMVSVKTRWALWEQEVLGQCSMVRECQELIGQRVELADDDANDAYEFEDLVASKLRDHTHDPDVVGV